MEIKILGDSVTIKLWVVLEWGQLVCSPLIKFVWNILVFNRKVHCGSGSEKVLALISNFTTTELEIIST